MAKSNKEKEPKFVKRDDYNLYEIFPNGHTHANKVIGRRKLHFKNLAIIALPFCDDGTVDIYDSEFASSEDGGLMFLRVGKRSKTFYPVPALPGRARKTCKSLGRFISKTSNHYKEDEADVAEARKRFRQFIINVNSNRNELQKIGDMTIRYYIDSGQYKKDRQNFDTKRNKRQHVSDITLNSLRTQFEPWLDFKLNQIDKYWAEEMQEHWAKPRFNNANGKRYPNGFSQDTLRRYFTQFNALVNTCVKAKYIDYNRIEDEISRFPKAKQGKIITYDMNYDDLIIFIFEQTRGSLAGKLIVATMVLTGARNAEVYKNFIDNWDFKNRSIFIPSKISKNKDVGERYVYPENDKYWQMMHVHTESIDRNKFGHMFPSNINPGKYLSATVYRDVWKDIKLYYGLKNDARLYSFRSTFGTRIAETENPNVAAKVLGDRETTANQYYIHIEERRIEAASRKAGSTDPKLLADNLENKSTTKSNTSMTDYTIPVPEAMPLKVLKLWSMFKARRLKLDGTIKNDDYSAFVLKVQKQFEDNKISGPDIEEWLDFQ